MMSNPADSSTLSPELIREFVMASHFNLPKVQEMLAENPALLTAEHDWGGESGFEDGLGAASHVGNRAIAEFFLAQGVPLTICTAAMLGKSEDVKAFLAQDPAQANARGAHGITVMFHAAMSGDLGIVRMLKDHGCKEGFSHSIHAAINFGHKDVVAWLLTNGAQDVNVLDYQSKTPLKHALDDNQPEIAELLKTHGAKETV
jgi:uncharacterized protein